MFRRCALADPMPDYQFAPYAMCPQYSPDGQEYYYNFHRFSYINNACKLPPKDYPVKEKEDVYIIAWSKVKPKVYPLKDKEAYTLVQNLK